MMDIDMMQGDNLLSFKVKKAKKQRETSNNPASRSVDLGKRIRAPASKSVLRVSKEDKRNIYLIS